MDMDAKDANGYMNKPLVSSDDQKVEGHENGGDDGETSSLLQRRGGISRKSDKARREVQWNDRNGNKLAEVLEFLPSDVSDSDDEDKDSCICTIM